MEPSLPSYLIGLDLGQAQDPTALAVLERTVRDTGRRARTLTWADAWGLGAEVRPRLRPVREAHYAVRHLERLPLGTPYPAVVGAVRRLLEGIDAAAGGPHRTRLGAPANAPAKALVVDATGVGRPVVDLLAGAGLAPVAVTITGGDTVGTDREGGWRVPKRDLVATLTLLMQTGRLKVAGALPEARLLQEELVNFRVRITAAAHDAYGAWREGQHDDLVLAVALAAWAGEYEPGGLVAIEV